MIQLDSPIRFHPFLRPLVWGGHSLARLLGKNLPNGAACGESWEISDHPLHRSVVAEGALAGLSLRALMERQRGELLGPAAEAHAIFPWLFKFVDASDWLSVQVHPDPVAVRKLWPGEGPKTEAWFVLAAAPGSRIYAGLLPGIGENDLRAALNQGRVADCLHSFEPRPGDCVFLPAGTVHAVGGGVLLAEIQQTSDATFRLFDWNRRDASGKPRPLHIEQAFASIHWDQGQIQPVRVSGYPGPAGQSQLSERTSLVECPYFHVEYVSDLRPVRLGGSGHLQAAVVLAGRGRSEDANCEVRTGQVWVLPASMPPVTLRPDPSLALMLCTLP
jgi:mannose-6-phosphate isomerase